MYKNHKKYLDCTEKAGARLMLRSIIIVSVILTDQWTRNYI